MQEFEFEEFFIYETPQKKLASLMDVTTTRRGDWSSFTILPLCGSGRCEGECEQEGRGLGARHVKNKEEEQ